MVVELFDYKNPPSQVYGNNPIIARNSSNSVNVKEAKSSEAENEDLKSVCAKMININADPVHEHRIITVNKEPINSLICNIL